MRWVAIFQISLVGHFWERNCVSELVLDFSESLVGLLSVEAAMGT